MAPDLRPTGGQEARSGSHVASDGVARPVTERLRDNVLIQFPVHASSHGPSDLYGTARQWLLEAQTDLSSCPR
jgi:hypothetical protein